MRVLKRVAWALVALLGVGFGVASARYLTFDPKVFPDTSRAAYEATSPAIYAHVLPGIFAVVLGPFQFLDGLRKRMPVHRTIGRVYVTASLLSAVGALRMATVAYGELPARLGLGCLGVLWLISTTCGFAAIRRRRIAAHRAWMTRSYSQTLAIVMFRLELPILVALGASYLRAYQICAWASWILNGLIAEWMIRSAETSPQVTVELA